MDHKKTLDGLNIVIIGDLDHSRVTSSFVEGVSNFDLGSKPNKGRGSLARLMLRRFAASAGVISSQLTFPVFKTF